MAVRRKTGQSIFEVVLALGFLSLVAVAVLNLAVISLNSAQVSLYQSRADSYLNETLEWLKSEKTKDWTGFVARASAEGAAFCLMNLDWSLPGDCASQGQPSPVGGSGLLYRETVISLIGELAHSETKVYWTDGRGYHELKTVSEFGPSEGGN